MINDRKPCAMRGRMPLKQERSEYGKQIRKDYEGGEVKVPRANIQQFEIRKDGMSNTITTVSKDTLTIGRWDRMSVTLVDKSVLEGEEVKTDEPKVEDYLFKDYGVFKLSVREVGRLMGVTDSDIDKMMAVNSNTRCYAGFGNSIVTTVLMALFSQLHIKGVPVWNEMTEEERMAMADSVRDWDNGEKTEV